MSSTPPPPAPPPKTGEGSNLHHPESNIKTGEGSRQYSPNLTQKRESASSAPIGVFDSGLGGLTVVRQMQAMLPDERVIFVADQAHVPYGGRELSEVRGFACGISEALIRAGCKAIVMACNISSATALEAVREVHPNVPIFGVIAPGAEAAAEATRNGRIGVLATLGTTRSGAYTRAFHALNPDLQVTEIACPKFVPLVEAGQQTAPEAFAAAQEYLALLQNARVDTVVLGCTHYPFLMTALETAAPKIRFVDPAAHTVRELKQTLTNAGLLSPGANSPHRLTTTGEPDAFAAQLCRFLPETSDYVIGTAEWNASDLEFISLPAAK